MKELNAGEVHFVRCGKPNENSTPRRFNHKLVLEQMRASGIFDAVELMKKRLSNACLTLPFMAGLRRDASRPRSASPAEFSELCALACDSDRKITLLGAINSSCVPDGRASRGSYITECEHWRPRVSTTFVTIRCTGAQCTWSPPLFRVALPLPIHANGPNGAQGAGSGAATALRKIYGVINLTSLKR